FFKSPAYHPSPAACCAGGYVYIFARQALHHILSFNPRCCTCKDMRSTSFETKRYNADAIHFFHQILPDILHPFYAGVGGQAHCHGRNADRKSTRLNSSHVSVSYAVFCLKKKKNEIVFYGLHTTICESLSLYPELE